jgi:hypothetical protein
MSYTKRQFLKTAAVTAAAGALPGVIGSRVVRAADPVKVGILHSLPEVSPSRKLASPKLNDWRSTKSTPRAA